MEERNKENREKRGNLRSSSPMGIHSIRPGRAAVCEGRVDAMRGIRRERQPGGGINVEPRLLPSVRGVIFVDDRGRIVPAEAGEFNG
jgi:hypothetical protein